MSDPGMTLDQYQQMQMLQKRQAMAAALMSNQAGNQNASYGGLANAGNSILGAILSNSARDDQQKMISQMQRGAAATPDLSQLDDEGNPIALTGGQAAPGGTMGAPAKKPGGWFSGLSNLFSFGGGS